MRAIPVHRLFRRAQARQGSIGMAVSQLVAVALITTWLCEVLPIENAITTMGPDDKLILTVVKGQFYYFEHALALASVLAAGCFSVFRGQLGMVSIGVRTAFCVLLVTATIWAAQAYTADEILSQKIFSSTGPFVWFTILLTLAGVEEPIWKYIDPVIRGLAYVSSVLAIKALIGLKYSSYLYFSKYSLYCVLLMWLGGWTLLTATRLRGWPLLFRTIPYMVFVLMAICSQSRSWTIQAFLVAAIFVWLRSREQGSATSGIRALIIGCVMAFVVWSVVYAITPETMDASINGLARLSEDTRSGQYRAFFAVVPVGDLLLGRGPKGTWYWPNVGEYQFFDNGYLWLLFIGGVPTLLCYVIIVLWPALRSFRRSPRGEDAAAVAMVTLWGLALAGLGTYTLPSLGLNNFLVALWAGRCHGFLAGQEGRASAAAAHDFVYSAALPPRNRFRPNSGVPGTAAQPTYSNRRNFPANRPRFVP